MLARTLTLLTPLVLAGCLPTLRVTPRYGQLELGGDLNITSSSVTSTNSVSDLGLDDEEGTPSALVDIKWGMPHLSISTQSASFSGTGTLDAELDLGGNTIPAGADVDSDVDLAVHQGILTFDIAPTDVVELGIGFGVVGIDFDAEFVELGTGETVETEETLPIPVVSARAAIWIGSVEVAGLASALKFEEGDDEIRFLDIDAYARYHFFGFSKRGSGSLVLGYRYTRMDAQYEDGNSDVDADITVDGPYVGLQFGF